MADLDPAGEMAETAGRLGFQLMRTTCILFSPWIGTCGEVRAAMSEDMGNRVVVGMAAVVDLSIRGMFGIRKRLRAISHAR